MEFTINNDFHNVRLDTFIKKTYQEIPLSGIYKMIRKGNVKVNKKKKKQNYRLQTGDLVRVWESSAPTVPKPAILLSADAKELLQASIVFENKDIILCNKPMGMVMHAGSSHDNGFTEQIQAHTKNPHFTFVHRLDKMTSGLVMGAKNHSTARQLSALIRERKIIKKYIVLVAGTITQKKFTLRMFLKKEADKVRVYPNENSGAKEAVSEFLVLQHRTHHTLLQAELHTGRTHQLRVQLAAIGHPIIGDTKYGEEKITGKNQMFLFSQHLIIPSLDIDFSLPVPKYFSAVLSKKAQKKPVSYQE